MRVKNWIIPKVNYSLGRVAIRPERVWQEEGIAQESANNESLIAVRFAANRGTREASWHELLVFNTQHERIRALKYACFSGEARI